MSKISTNLIRLIFTLLFFSSIFTLISKDKKYSEMEKRELTTLSDINWNSPKSIFKKFDLYASDQFIFREKLSSFHNYFKIKMGSSPNKDVTIGKKGMFFLGSPSSNFPNLINKKNYSWETMTEEQISKFIDDKYEINNYLKSKKIFYLLLISPNKVNIYSDYLPDERFSKENSPTSLEKISNYILNNTDIAFLNLENELKKFKELNPSDLIYFKNDSHWNNLGANIAQLNILKKIYDAESLNLSELTLYEMDNNKKQKRVGDLSAMMNAKHILSDNPQIKFKKDECIPKKVITEKEKNTSDIYTYCDTKNLKVVVFRDSFFTALIPFISRKFGEVKYIWKYPDIYEVINVVEKYNPDIIIDQIVERYLWEY